MNYLCGEQKDLHNWYGAVLHLQPHHRLCLRTSGPKNRPIPFITTKTVNSNAALPPHVDVPSAAPPPAEGAGGAGDRNVTPPPAAAAAAGEAPEAALPAASVAAAGGKGGAWGRGGAGKSTSG